jgi:predicted phage terminase large subunit-like protein
MNESYQYHQGQINKKILIEIEYRKRKKAKLQEQCKELYFNNLSKFIVDAWHVLEPEVDYKSGWAIDCMCDHLMAITDGQFNRFLCNVPPGMMKSLMFNVWWPAWEWGVREMPWLKSLGASYNKDYEIRDNLKLRNLVNSEWYQERFGDIVQLTKDQKLKTNFWLTGGGGRSVTPITSMTGSRADRVTIDDPHSVDSAESDTLRKSVCDTFDRAATTRLVDPEKSVISIIMQRLHMNDLSGHVLKEVKNQQGELIDRGFIHLVLPMEFESKRKCTTIIGFEDPRKEDGELLFPERFPKWVVDRDKAAMGEYAAAGQLQQNPAPSGGGLFKDEYWRFYSRSEEIQFKYKFMVADTAMKIGDGNDYSVVQHWGVSGDGSDEMCYLIDQLRGKWTIPELHKSVLQYYNEQYSHEMIGLFVEDKSSGIGLIQFLSEQGINVQALDSKWTRISKEDRALSKIHLIGGQDEKTGEIRRGKFCLPEDAEWINEFLNEHRSFPRASHDDQVDCTIYSAFIFCDNQSIYSSNWI